MTDPWDEPSDFDEWTDAGDDLMDDDPTYLDSQIGDPPGPRMVADLPGGTGSLILSGPGAGTTVLPASEESVGGQQHSGRVASRDEALSGSYPLMIVHAPHQNRSTIPRLLASVLASTAGTVALGAAVKLPSGSTTAHAEWLGNCAGASIRLADPTCFLLDPNVVRVKGISPLAARRAPYLTRLPLDTPAILDAQREAGANVLLSTGRALDPADPQPSLDAVFAEADTALAALQSGERLFLNLTIPSQWLSNPILRSALFGQLLDQEQFDLWHIRVQWSSGLRALHQPVDKNLLDGYKRLSQLAADENRVLVLPQTGLTGWLQLGFGATGYGASLFGSGHAFKEESQGGGGGNPPIARYFEPTLLHSVERSTHEALSRQPGYSVCSCPYCPSLLSTADWNHELARLHHLHWMGRLAGVSGMTGRTPAAAVRRTVRAALAAAAGQPLAGISAPQHLQIWDQLL